MANIRKELALAFIQKYHPSTIQDLKRRLEDAGIGSTDEALLEAVQDLQLDGIIGLHYPARVESFFVFLGDFYQSWWIYGIILVSLVEPVLVVYPNKTLGVALLQGVFGLLLLGYLPGYATVKALFPGNRLSALERVLLSIFLSVTVSIAIGVALGAGYFFTATTSVVGSSCFTILAGFVAGRREYSALRMQVKR